jgi:hypothetical protein
MSKKNKWWKKNLLHLEWGRHDSSLSDLVLVDHRCLRRRPLGATIEVVGKKKVEEKKKDRKTYQRVELAWDVVAV